MSLNKSMSLMIAGLASLFVWGAQAQNNASAAASSCLNNRSGTPISELASNSAINGAISSVGGIRGLLSTWKSGGGGTVQFYQTEGGRLVLSYDYGLVSGSARITKVCALSSSLLRMNGSVQGEPFTMYVKGVGKPRSIEMGIDQNDLKDFNK
jgi:hypothetical protein